MRLIAAPHTPFGPDGELNLSAVERQADLLRRSGVAGVFIGGSTGEYASLSVPERRLLAERWAAVAEGLQVIVHVGANALPDAVELARHAATLPVQAIAALAPSYFRPQSVEDLIRFFSPIAGAAGNLPFYFYDIPSMTGVALPTAEFLRQGAERITTLAGVKFTNPDLALFQECLHLDGGRFEVFYGCDEQLLAGYALGATGAVGSTYNFAPGLYQRMVAAWDNGDVREARRLQHASVRLVRCLQRDGYMGSAKGVMALLGVPCGTVRPPLRPLTAAQLVALRERLAAEGLFEYLATV